jgi:2-polyprenyl-6-methoxyphenol hydroxylase-like FAD-dependent oxidoreductase
MILLGDESHGELILSGNGANEAIIDGIQLADAIAKGGREDVAAWYG